MDNSFWNKSVPTVQYVMTSLKQIVRDRIKVVMSKKISMKDSVWFLALYAYLVCCWLLFVLLTVVGSCWW